MPGVVFQQVANGLFNSQSEAAEATEAVLTLATKVAHRTRSGGSNTHSLGSDPVLGPCSVYVRTDPLNRTKSCSAEKKSVFQIFQEHFWGSSTLQPVSCPLQNRFHGILPRLIVFCLEDLQSFVAKLLGLQGVPK